MVASVVFCNSLDLYWHVKDIDLLLEPVYFFWVLCDQPFKTWWWVKSWGGSGGEQEAPAAFCYCDVSGCVEVDFQPFLLFPAVFFFMNQPVLGLYGTGVLDATEKHLFLNSRAEAVQLTILYWTLMPSPTCCAGSGVFSCMCMYVCVCACRGQRSTSDVHLVCLRQSFPPRPGVGEKPHGPTNVHFLTTDAALYVGGGGQTWGLVFRHFSHWAIARPLVCSLCKSQGTLSSLGRFKNTFS